MTTAQTTRTPQSGAINSSRPAPFKPPFCHYESKPDQYGVRQTIGAPNGRGAIVAIAHICPSGYAVDDAQTAGFMVAACNEYESLLAERDRLRAALERLLIGPHGRGDRPGENHLTSSEQARAALAQSADKGE